jgi:predicted Ser/Thr protein kinase
MTGRTIAGRYRVEEKIGEGGMATVYRAIDTALDRIVAIKVLRPSFAQDPEFVERFRREAHSAAKLSHPNIVQVFDTGSENGVYYIVMEYLPEPNLKRIIANYAPLPLRKVLEVAAEACEALKVAHQAGIVHRDIKPQNILFTNDGRVKIADFGIARAMTASDLTQTGTTIGSVHYISPEQAQGQPAGPHSDLYSLGVVMYEALTGRLPFQGESPVSVAVRHVRERPQSPRAFNPSITPSAEYVIMKALSKEIARRYASAAEMLADIRKIQEGADLDQTGILPMPDQATEAIERADRAERTAVMARPPQRPAPTRPVARPRPAPPPPAPAFPVSAVIVGLLLIIAVFAGLYFVMRQIMYPHEQVRQVMVPSVIGRTEFEASALLSQRGLRLGSKIYREDSGPAPPGTILEQSPPPDELVDADSEVDVVIKRAKETVTVPDVTGLDLTAAERLLRERQLSAGGPKHEYSDQAPKGQVISQSPDPGTQMQAGETVVLTVSDGPKPQEPPEQPSEPTPGEPGTAPETPTTGPEEPGAEESEPVNPQVEMVPEPPDPAHPEVKNIRVRITVQGRKPRQEIKVLVSDAERAEYAVVRAKRDPGDVIEQRITARGDTTVQVLVDDRPVDTRQF